MIDKKRLEAHLNNGEREYIMCAANYYDDGQDHLYQPYNIDKGFIVAGWRHPCCGYSYLASNPWEKRWDICVQGFLTNKNRFLNRDEALSVARESGQVIGDILGGELTSEDLW
jgi:hypothetical protein